MKHLRSSCVDFLAECRRSRQRQNGSCGHPESENAKNPESGCWSGVGGDDFGVYADFWWDEAGPMSSLHRINPLRLRYIHGMIEGWQKTMEQEQQTRFEGVDVESSAMPSPSAAATANVSGMVPQSLQVLDIGCGGGLVSLPLARQGYHVTGLDKDGRLVECATNKAAVEGLINAQFLQLDVVALTAAAAGNGEEAEVSSVSESGLSQLSQLPKLPQSQYDVVLALEIVEHLEHLSDFARTIRQLLRPGGLLIVSTINRTPTSFLKAIVMAEYVLGWVPKGTHSWRGFHRPSEIAAALGRDYQILDVSGMEYSPLRQKWLISKQVSTNYFMSCVLNG